MLAYAIVMSVYPICSTTSSEGDCRELQSLSSTDQAAFSLAKPRRVLTLQINKLWFGLAIFPALPICLSIECRSQLWKRTRGPSKELILYSVDIFLYKYSVCLHAWDAWFQIQWTIDPALPKALEEGGVFLRRWKLLTLHSLLNVVFCWCVELLLMVFCLCYCETNPYIYKNCIIIMSHLITIQLTLKCCILSMKSCLWNYALRVIVSSC
jgi:hypothetical protein